MQLEPSKQERANELSRGADTPARGIIVARDALTSSLLAKSLSQDFNFVSITAPHFDLLRILKTTRCDVVIISAELNSNPRAGLDLSTAVSAAYPKLPIVILVDQLENNVVASAFHSGARGVFDLQDPMSEFVDCMQRVTKGGIWAGEKVTNHLLEAFRSSPSPSVSSVDQTSCLSARELEVVQCAARGRTNQQIAEELRLSKHTVKNYLFKAFDKLGVSSRVELLFHLSTSGHLHRHLKREAGA